MTFQPAIKWSGSKRSQAEQLLTLLPEKSYDTYYEPFCGGCSMLNRLLHSDITFESYIVSDINQPLIALWQAIQQEPLLVAEHYRKLWVQLTAQPDVASKRAFFNEIRERFNQTHSPYDFLFIMRTTSNGMPRYNRQGAFNNSFHLTRNGIHPDTLQTILLAWSEQLTNHSVQFIHQSYEHVQTTANDFLYLDPPYANTKGMYYGALELPTFWDWLRKQPSDYLLSFDGRTSDQAYETNVPTDIYTEHLFLKSGNSSFGRLFAGSSNRQVEESVYKKERVR